jgi:NAD(P)-dependent dehydrogenase (short-subunit alcohol dehydrogenase family)
MTRLPGARRRRHRWRWRDWPAAARLLQVRSARVAVLDRSTDGAPDGVLALRCDVTDTPAVDAAVTSARTTTRSGPACSTSTSQASLESSAQRCRTCAVHRMRRW